MYLSISLTRESRRAGYDMRHSKFGKPAVKLTCKQPPSAIVVHPTESLIVRHTHAHSHTHARTRDP